jgi:hypothetical protein
MISSLIKKLLGLETEPPKLIFHPPDDSLVSLEKRRVTRRAPHTIRLNLGRIGASLSNRVRVPLGPTYGVIVTQGRW